MTTPAPLFDQLSPRWQSWIVENLVRGVDRTQLLDVLCGRGLSLEEARSAADVGLRDVAAFAKRQLELVQKYEDQFENLARLRRITAPPPVPRRPPLPRDVFVSEHYAANRPVVMAGLLDGSPLLEWTPEGLADRCGDVIVEVQVGRRQAPIWDVFLRGKSKEISFREYVGLVRSAGETNEFYLTGNDRFLSRPGADVLVDDISFASEYLDHSSTARNAHLWLGPRGAVSPLHRDRVNVLMAQLYGRKRILMADPTSLPNVYNSRSFFSDVDAEDPDLDRFPRFASVDLVDVTVEPGDCLFLPVGWWHHVRSLDVTMTLTFTNFVFENSFL